MKQISQHRLALITGARTPIEQCQVLRQLGIVPLIRIDGSVCVFEEVLREAMLIARQKTPADEPDWSALDGAA